MRLTLLRLKENCAVLAAPRILAIMIADDSNAGLITAGGQGSMDAQSIATTASITKSSQMRLTLLCLKAECASASVLSIITAEDSNAGLIDAGTHEAMIAQSHS